MAASDDELIKNILHFQAAPQSMQCFLKILSRHPFGAFIALFDYSPLAMAQAVLGWARVALCGDRAESFVEQYWISFSRPSDSDSDSGGGGFWGPGLKARNEFLALPQMRFDFEFGPKDAGIPHFPQTSAVELLKQIYWLIGISIILALIWMLLLFLALARP